jgi:hypothetical protein
MADLFSFGYDLLQNFCFVCKNFLLASFINENEVFSLKKNYYFLHPFIAFRSHRLIYMTCFKWFTLMLCTPVVYFITHN